MFDISLYNDDFFEWHHKHTREYQINTFQWYIDVFKPKSVVDFGCGIGTYLETALKNGITKIKGFDIGGEFARKYTPPEVQPFIEYVDCTKPIALNKIFDTVISFETAEHIDPSGTETFISNIIKACRRGTILFTAAPPGQDGCGHINMHKKGYWIDLFESLSLGVFYDHELSVEISTEWNKIGCPEYISGNLIVFDKLF